MYLPPSENLAINTLSGIFSDMSESYKIFWFNGILDGISEGKSVQLFDDIVNRMIVDAWYMVTEYHLNLGPSDALEKLIHMLQADCGLPSNAKEKDILSALANTQDMLEKEYTNYVLDADIKGFFDHLDHGWIIKFVESRIKDPNIIRLVRVMLKAGIMKDYTFEETEEGSGQGSVCSPVIANIYMHYVLIWWFKEKIQPKARGFCGLVVYADDFVVCFQYKDEAETFYKLLGDRMEHFGLTLEKEKSRLIEFGRFAERDCMRKTGRKPETFTFLGFTHYCSHAKNGKFRVKRKTSRKKFNKKVKEMSKTIRDMVVVYGLPIKEVMIKLNQILIGYFHYYGITDNAPMISLFRLRVQQLLFKWLNRRSQRRRSISWEGFNDLLNTFPLAKARIYVSIYGD